MYALVVWSDRKGWRGNAWKDNFILGILYWPIQHLPILIAMEIKRVQFDQLLLGQLYQMSKPSETATKFFFTTSLHTIEKIILKIHFSSSDRNIKFFGATFDLPDSDHISAVNMEFNRNNDVDKYKEVQGLILTFMIFALSCFICFFLSFLLFFCFGTFPIFFLHTLRKAAKKRTFFLHSWFG